MIGHAHHSLPILRHLWLEVTGRCNLTCAHCYAGSSPRGTHGIMSSGDWLRVIDEAKDLGVGAIQFIGGEPTLHPDFLGLLERASDGAARVEVYSNLASIKDDYWAAFQGLGIAVATSFYSADAGNHDRMTGRRGSQLRTLRNIERAVSKGISLRVSVISRDGCDRDAIETERLLVATGVKDIAWDRVRGVGRGEEIKPESSLEALCGNCASGSAAITPSGEVFPCIMDRSATTGNVLSASLADVLSGAAMQTRLTTLRHYFAARPASDRSQNAGCQPSTCGPNSCGPSVCGPDSCNPNSPPPKCSPIEPREQRDKGRPPDFDRFKKNLPKNKINPSSKIPKIDPGKGKPL